MIGGIWRARNGFTVIPAIVAPPFLTTFTRILQPNFANFVNSPSLQKPYLSTGFMSAFTIIFLSELGDKTFFIAGLLAAKIGRAVAFAGTMIALGAMTVISVGIGVAFTNIPAPLLSSMPVGEWVGAVMLTVFGVTTIVVSGKAGGWSCCEKITSAKPTVLCNNHQCCTPMLVKLLGSIRTSRLLVGASPWRRDRHLEKH